jgi:hypothetical protein
MVLGGRPGALQRRHGGGRGAAVPAEAAPQQQARLAEMGARPQLGAAPRQRLARQHVRLSEMGAWLQLGVLLPKSTQPRKEPTWGCCGLYFGVTLSNITFQNIYIMPGRAGGSGSRGSAPSTQYTLSKRGTADYDTIGGGFWAPRGSYWRRGPRGYILTKRQM